MKAAVIRKFGDAEVIKVEDVETPKPRPGHVLIKILAAGVNRLDHYIREGSIVPELRFPHILGADAAGEIAELGKGVTGLAIGERVIPAPGYALDPNEEAIAPPSLAPSFALPGLHIAGTYAQYIEIPAQFVAKDDTGLSPDESATLPVALGGGQRDRLRPVSLLRHVAVARGGRWHGPLHLFPGAEPQPDSHRPFPGQGPAHHRRAGGCRPKISLWDFLEISSASTTRSRILPDTM